MGINQHRKRRLKQPPLKTIKAPAKGTQYPALVVRKLRQGWYWLVGAIVLLLLAIGLVIGSSWLAVKFIVNPEALGWLNQWVPSFVPVSVTGSPPSQTLTEIQHIINNKEGRTAGELLRLSKNKSFLDQQSTVAELLLPILESSPNCQIDCGRIVELRLYQAIPRSKGDFAQPERWQLVDQMAIAGLPAFLVAPLDETDAVSGGSSRTLPLTHLGFFEDADSSQGVWLNLNGQWQQGTGSPTYGKVLHYNPNRLYLSALLDWSSPTGKQPHWQADSNGKKTELLINQTSGMEPQFRLYRVKPRRFLLNPIQLEPVSLNDCDLGDRTYRRGLLLAQAGLWSQALQEMETVKRHGKEWSALAQVQMELVQHHASFARTQAEQTWASPNQQVLADLIDGHWQKALKVVTTNPEGSGEITTLLKVNSDRLLRRVRTALAIDPTNADAKTWGAVLMAIQTGKQGAIAWLKQQPQTSKSEITQIDRLLKQLVS
jgi:hypothetical protein